MKGMIMKDPEDRIPPIDINVRVVQISKKESKRLNKKMTKRENVWDALVTNYIIDQLKEKR